MSVQINCDRCGKNTRGFFLNLTLKVQRGSHSGVDSKISPARRGIPRDVSWHICESCERDLGTWQQAPAEEARAA